MSLQKLFEDGFLKKIPASKERAEKSLLVSQRYLAEAEKTFEAECFEMAIFAAYASAFHAARAILFSDGIGERSHFAIVDYLKEKHKALGVENINSFDFYRQLRHSVAYGLDTAVGEEDAKEAIKFSKGFLKTVKAYLKL
ncbi:HEPN domain-containing protein [Candidatus Micrarchaeota archaeon]|nr:HEPN domain-containing protein [Candidatus Micrarchaeota archaeon]